MSKLANQVALVTGGSRGIGAAIAKRLAADGAAVAITYSKDDKGAVSVVQAIERAGGKAVAIQADAANAEAVKNAVEKTVKTLGRIDILVNNAGTAIPKPLSRLRSRRSTACSTSMSAARWLRRRRRCGT
jgi:3-oxoacyl-[acyl-carrier protein] reductase